MVTDSKVVHGTALFVALDWLFINRKRIRRFCVQCIARQKKLDGVTTAKGVAINVKKPVWRWENNRKTDFFPPILRHTRCDTVRLCDSRDGRTDYANYPVSLFKGGCRSNWASLKNVSKSMQFLVRLSLGYILSFISTKKTDVSSPRDREMLTNC